MGRREGRVAAVVTGIGDAALTYVFFAMNYGISTVLPAPVLLFIAGDAAAIIGGERFHAFAAKRERATLAAGVGA